MSAWKPGEPIPEAYSGMPVTFEWNDVALTALLTALRERYPTGYASMCGHIRDAMQTFEVPKPEEPTGLGAVVEDDEGQRWVRTDPDAPAWTRWDASLTRVSWPLVHAVRILSEGVTS